MQQGNTETVGWKGLCVHLCGCVTWVCVNFNWSTKHLVCFQFDTMKHLLSWPPRFGSRTGERKRRGWRKMPDGRGGDSISATWRGRGEARNRTKTASRRRAWTVMLKFPSQVNALNYFTDHMLTSIWAYHTSEVQKKANKKLFIHYKRHFFFLMKIQKMLRTKF